MNDFAPKSAVSADAPPVDYSGLVPTPEAKLPDYKDMQPDDLVTVLDFVNIMAGTDGKVGADESGEAAEAFIHFSLHTREHKAFEFNIVDGKAEFAWTPHTWDHWVAFSTDVMLGMMIGVMPDLHNKY